MSDSATRFMFELRVWRSVTHAGDSGCYDNFTVVLYNFL